MEISYYDIYNKMVKISVIVPVYNVVSCISHCIDSIIEQTLTDWELLLIDDGSSDGSALICDDYSSKDKRIKVFHKENGGVSSARNAGLDVATGDWVVFVDSDDWCEPDYLAAFFDTGINPTEDDIVLQGRKNEVNECISSTTILKNAIYKNIAEGVLTNNLLTFGAPYCKLYSNRPIRKYNIRFPENYSYGEDTTFFFKILSHVERMITTDTSCYHYVDSEDNSLSKKDHDFEPLKDFLLDSMTLVKAIDSKFNMDGALINAYIPNYKNLLLRSIANMYRLRYPADKIVACFSVIKKELLSLLIDDKSLITIVLRLCPVHILNMIFNIIMKIRR